MASVGASRTLRDDLKDENSAVTSGSSEGPSGILGEVGGVGMDAGCPAELAGADFSQNPEKLGEPLSVTSDETGGNLRRRYQNAGAFQAGSGLGAPTRRAHNLPQGLRGVILCVSKVREGRGFHRRLRIPFFPRLRLCHRLEPFAKVQTLRHIRRHHKDSALVFPHVEKMLALFGRCAAKKSEDQ